jgi:hypothetical protein
MNKVQHRCLAALRLGRVASRATPPPRRPAHPPRPQHVVGRLFYPASPQPPRRRWPAAAPSWIGGLDYAKGYVAFAFFSARTLKLKIIKNVLQAVIWMQGRR